MGAFTGERGGGKRLRAAAFWPYVQEIQRPGNDCAKCRTSQALRSAWGCEGPSRAGPWGQGFTYDLGGTVINRCPLKLLRHPWTQAVLALFGSYRHGITPNGSGLRRETLHYQRAMQAIESASSEAASWYMKKQNDSRRPDNGHIRQR